MNRKPSKITGSLGNLVFISFLLYSTYAPPFTDADVIVTAVLLSVFLLIGVVANALTIAVILTSATLR